MTDHLAPLSDDPNDFCFFDTETRALEGLQNPLWGNVKHTSTGRYARSSKVVLLTYGIGETGEVKHWALDDFSKTLRWADAPDDLADFLDRARAGEAWFVAYNSAFDRNVCNHGMVGLTRAPTLPVSAVIDAMAQAAASNLPGGLDRAAKSMALDGKMSEGRDLINLFCNAGGGTPASHPAEWQRFIDYAVKDTALVRELFFATRSLSRMEWEQFWASEAINDRGMPADRDLLMAASAMFDLYHAGVQDKVREFTGGACNSVYQHTALVNWVADELDHLPEAVAILESEASEETEDGFVPAKLSLARDRVERLIAYLERLDRDEGLTDPEFDVLQLLETRLYGASATPKKFEKALPALTDGGRLPNQYVYNGAQQTGRFSSRGIQLHNLSRRTIDDEAEALAFLQDHPEPSAADLIAFEERFGSAGKALSRLIRPAITAPAGRTLVWSDWSAIEARVLPWLSASRGGDEILDIFRAVDADPSSPDIYMREAGNISGKNPAEVDDEERQTGKVAVLALGFGGGIGALQVMATAYGMSLHDDEAQRIVTLWRGNNRWAKVFWDRLWDGFLNVMENPDTVVEVGRVAMVHDAGYMNGTTFIVLPDGRPLSYPALKWRKDEVEGPDGTTRTRDVLTFRRGDGRRKLWHGTIAENITQATAASLLRHSLAHLPASPTEAVVGHTHDEIIMECDDNPRQVRLTSERLKVTMETNPGWADGLPLAAEVSTNWYYTKDKEALK